MGEKRWRAEANDDERQAPTDGNTRRTAGMTHDEEGSETGSEAGSEAGRYRKTRRFNKLKSQTRRREQRDDMRRYGAIQTAERQTADI